MKLLEIENHLDTLEKEHSYSPSFYKKIEDWLTENNLYGERDLETLLKDLDKTLSELYKYKKSLKIINQRGVEKKVIDILDTHIEIEVSEPEVTLKF